MRIYGTCAELAERNGDTDQLLGLVTEENDLDEFSYKNSFGEGSDEENGIK